MADENEQEPETPEGAGEPGPQSSEGAEEHRSESPEANDVDGSATSDGGDGHSEQGGHSEESPVTASDVHEIAFSEEAVEIAGVAEDAPVEAAREAAEAAVVTAAEEATDAAVVGGEREEYEEDVAEEIEMPRVRPAVPGAHLEVDIVPEGVDPLGSSQRDPYAVDEDGEDGREGDGEDSDSDDGALSEPIATAAIDLAAGARYSATGKRKTAIARVTLRPGTGTYLVNGRTLEEHFPRVTSQRNVRQPLETVGYQERMDIVARLHGGGISAQAGALRHGISRALLEADPNLRGELKRRGFLTRDSRAKERKKAGLKKARKRPQFSKR